MYSIVVIGGGASGLVSAIAAAQFFENIGIDKKILILERMPKLGKKILSTGNGRCNLSNTDLDVKYYHGTDPKFVTHILSKFGYKEASIFFKSLGVLCKEEEHGKVYPYSDQASSVLDVLRMEIERLDIKVNCNCNVDYIKKEGDCFIIKTTDTSELGNNLDFKAKKVIVSTGGRATPDAGSNGSGYKLLSNLGHAIVPQFQTIVQLASNSVIPNSLTGIKFKGSASIAVNSEILQTESGEILFRNYGFSGPCVLQLSRCANEYLTKEKTKKDNKYKVSIILDLLPDFSEKELLELLTKRMYESKHKLLETFLIGLLNKKLGQVLLKESGIEKLSRTVISLSKAEILKIVKNIKRWEFPITKVMSWNNAQATAGGVAVKNFSHKTLESNIISGLYATGELLDIDGDCGGYNLQWAWSSGYIAGTCAAQSFF